MQDKKLVWPAFNVVGHLYPFQTEAKKMKNTPCDLVYQGSTGVHSSLGHGIYTCILQRGHKGIVDFGPWLSSFPAHPIMANIDEIICKKKLKMR